ncbi:MAG: hypothetical protein IK093_15790 [Ruminiclostridium sp.]|nr:hypothetical protein [Ruminiclostridium sp.]
MLKIRKRLLTACLAAVITVSAASVPVWSESEGAEDIADASAEETAGEADVGEEDTGIYVTEAEALADMKIMAENSKLALYVNEKKATFMIEDKQNGHKWWSSYYNTDSSNKTRLSKRSTPISIDVVSTESKTVESSVRAYDTNVTKSCEKIENGVRFLFNYTKYDIEIPLEIVINNDGTFSATVKSESIVENRPETDPVTKETGYQVLNVHILENMGSTAYTEEGMFIVPDGSGAVINYNNGTAYGDNNTFESKVYGEDLAVGKLYGSDVIEKVTMPVMANINKTAGAGLVMIATDGDAYAIEHAMVTGQNVTDLNACWFEYTVRTRDNYFMGNSNTALTVYEAEGIKSGDLTTTYYPIYGDDLDWSDAANVYRDYLTNNVGVGKKTKSNDSPYYITLYGGTVKTQSVLGFPVDIQTAATTYKEALEIIKKLEEKGVNNIKIIYEDFSETGIVGEVAANFQYSSKLGGKNDYVELKKYVEAQQYELFPSCDIMEFYKSGNGYSFTLNASKQITKAYATQTPFDLAFGLPHLTKSSWTILSPWYFTDIFNKLRDSFKAEGTTSISLNQASNTLYSDFSRENKDGRAYIVREDTINILTEGYQKLKDNGFTIMAENANQYLLPYVDYIKDVPMYSSNYDIFDYDVPFAEMVLHGLIPYTTKAINKSADAEELRLLTLVTGTPIHYEMMYENPNKFADSEYDILYYTNYTGWLDRSVNEYKLFDEIVKTVSDAKITKYRRISDREFESTFDNGNVIRVNTEKDEITFNNKSIDLKDYGLGVADYE